MKNPTTRRFVSKTFGRWFTPVTRQWWLCVFVLLAVLMWSAYAHNFFDPAGPNPQQYIGFLVDVFTITLSSSRLFDRYTDGELKRRRGQKN